MQKKILITFLIIFLTIVIFNINSIFAVGIVSQAWVNHLEDGKTSLLFRTYTGPHEASTLRNYHKTNSDELVEGGAWDYTCDGVTAKAKWIYEKENGTVKPATYTFVTIGFALHTVPMGDYSSGNKIGYTYTESPLASQMVSIQEAIDRSYSKYTTPTIAKQYDDTVFYEIMRMSGKYTKVDWGTGLKITELNPTGQTQYRYTIVNLGESEIYVADNIIRNADLVPIIQQLKEFNIKDKCYISNIIISKTLHRTGGYEVARTAKDFFSQYDLDYGWGQYTSGIEEPNKKSMEAVTNLYDNELVFPKFSTRTVLVRHINIGNNTTISSSIVDNAKRIPSTNITLLAGNPTETITGANISLNYQGYEEYYEGLLDIEQSITKTALPNTNEYKCIGYNIGVSNTEDGALANVESMIKNSKYTSGNEAYVPSKSADDATDFVVIDFYYSEYEEDVEVNHLFVDKNGSVIQATKQTIKPNQTALMNNQYINRINQDVYVREVYRKQRGYGVTTRIADSVQNQMKNGTIKYIGHETFDEIVSYNSIVGTQRKNLNTAQNVTLNGNKKQVNYYYYYIEQVKELEPKKDIEGQVFVEATGNNKLEASCDDTGENMIVTSIPSGSQAKVGIKGIPRYMVSAITTEYVLPQIQENTINVTLNFTMGEQKKTVKYSNLKYRVGYYKVTDMAVYKLTNTTIYDANKGYDGTIGDSLFNWKNGKLSITPKDMKFDVSLTGINNRKIANNPTAINDINNYVAVSIEDKYGNKTTSGTSTSTLTREYLSNEQIDEVDANKDKIINSLDKTFADNELNRYNNILNEKKYVQSEKQSIYDSKVNELNNLKSIFDSAQKELDRLYKNYKDKSIVKSTKYVAKMNAENQLVSSNNSLTEEEEELKELKLIVSRKLIEVGEANKKLNAATTELNRLKNIYDSAVSEREALKEKANCIDSVEDDVYEELEQEEKDALEQCKKDKEAYAENLTNKVVENAKQEYDSYKDNEYTKASEQSSNLEKEYATATTNVQNKQKQIDDLKVDILNLEVLIETLSREYDEYVKDEYTPSKQEYESYRDNEYKIAKDNYDNYVAQNHVGIAKAALDEAITNTNGAQRAYNSYNKYRNNLYAKYDSYKALYDEFMSITDNNIETAKLLGLKINIFAQNMIIKVNDTPLASASSNTVSYSSDLASYISNSQVPYVKTEIPVIDKKVYSNIGNTILTEADYNNVNNIDKTVLNGVRALAGKAEYTAQVVIGSKTATEVIDTIYYSDQQDPANPITFKLKDTKLTKTYKVDTSYDATPEIKYKETLPVNVYTPITVTAELVTDEDDMLDQTKDTLFDTSIIQLNVPFTINFGSDEKPDKYNLNNTNKYSLGYYIKFDFDVQEVYINGKKYNRGAVVPAGTWIGMIPKNDKGKAYITAQATGNFEDASLDMVSEERSTYRVRAVAYNATTSMQDRSKKYPILSDMIKETSDLKDILANICKNPSYFAEKEYGVAIINRVYDFRVTDVKDISWKSVFRKTNSSATNAHTGTAYYSGTTKWNADSEQSNSIISRTVAEIGRNPLRILPVGPYKSTDTTYIKAPKLGYRFSYDMKVTGSYYDKDGNARENKKVKITTKFYYISKDGKTFLEEFDGTKKGIYLFYKTSAGKYVKIANDGGNYELRFTPNDGYRLVSADDLSTLSTKSLKLGDLRNITLTKEMATANINNTAITYYGEYKLPNSTIAVEVDKNGKYDINEHLKDGYIGVVFDIVAYSGTINIDNLSQEVLLSYSKNTKKDKPNTSQWDYEAFLGYTEYGSIVTDGKLKIKLEKGVWEITDEIYNSIKGSVILYDMDNRAATDYE